LENAKIINKEKGDGVDAKEGNIMIAIKIYHL